MDEETKYIEVSLEDYNNKTMEIKQLRKLISQMQLAFPAKDNRAEWCRRIGNGESPASVIGPELWTDPE